MVYRVGGINGEKVAQMTKEMTNFNLQVAKKEKEKLEVVNIRLEKVLEAYNEKIKEVDERNRLISRLRK